MNSETELVNRALRRLALAPIASLDEGSDRSEDALGFFQSSIDAFLSVSQWSFARRTVKPARLYISSPEPLPYANAFALPSDWVHTISVTEDTRRRLFGILGSSWRPVEFKIMLRGDTDSRAILTDADAIILDYISRATIANWPATAIDATACYLAAEMALSLQNNTQRAQQLMQHYEALVTLTMKNDTFNTSRAKIQGHHYSDARY